MTLKSFTLIFFLLFINTVKSQKENKIEWLDDLELALNISKESKKPILMYFTGSDWCTYCKMLNTDFFSTKKFQDKSINFVLLKIDLPMREDIISPERKKINKSLVNKYNKKGGFPSIYMLNEIGNVVDKISSYNEIRDSSRYFNFLDKALENFR